MKKSRITKLALSGAAVAALAATFSTSTYAWYVSNKQADVKGGTGTTGSAGSDGSVLVSWTGGDGEVWFKEINFEDDTDAVKNALSPIHYSATNASNQSAPAFYGITDTGTQGTASTAYIQFEVYVKTGTTTTVTPHITLQTTKQATNNGQVAYVADNTYVQAKAFRSGATYYTRSYEYKLPTAQPTSETFGATTYYLPGSEEGTYVVASTFDSSKTYYIYAEKYTAAAPTSENFANAAYYLKCDNTLPDGAEKGASFTADAKKAIWVQQVVDNGATTYWSPDTTSANGDAHAYYTAVTGYEPWAQATENSALGTIGTTANVGKKVTYTIYLDGGDVDCYNSCAGYDITFDLQFTIGN